MHKIKPGNWKYIFLGLVFLFGDNVIAYMIDFLHSFKLLELIANFLSADYVNELNN